MTQDNVEKKVTYAPIVGKAYFWPEHFDPNPNELVREMGQQVTEFLQIDDDGQTLLLAVSFNTNSDQMTTPNPGWQMAGVPVSPLDVYKKISRSDSNGVEVDADTLKKFQVGVLELKLPIIAAAYLAGKSDVTLAQMRADYQPGESDYSPTVIKLTGPSRAGKSQLLAIEAFKGNIAVVASEPFSDYGFNNYLTVLQNFAKEYKEREHKDLDPSTFTDKQFLEIINNGMKQMDKSGSFPSRQTSISRMIDNILEYCKTGHPRPKEIYFDLNGYSENVREPHKYDLVTMFAPDVLVLAVRGYEASVDGVAWEEVGVDKRAVDVDEQVIADYRQQLNSHQLKSAVQDRALVIRNSYLSRLTP